MDKKVVNSKKSEKENLTSKALKAVGMVLWAGSIIIAAQYIVTYPMYWILGKATLSQPVWTTICSTLIYIVAAAIIIFIPILINKKWKSDREELGLTGLPTFTDIGLAILGFVATIICSGIILYILQKMGVVDSGQTQDVGYSHLNQGFDRAIAFIALAVITPFFEELIFRGWLYGKLRKNKIIVGVAIALTSILFGALHGQWNVGITVGIMSIIMCIQRELTGTIYAGVITHMIKNGAAFALLLMTGAL